MSSLLDQIKQRFERQFRVAALEFRDDEEPSPTIPLPLPPMPSLPPEFRPELLRRPLLRDPHAVREQLEQELEEARRLLEDSAAERERLTEDLKSLRTLYARAEERAQEVIEALRAKGEAFRRQSAEMKTALEDEKTRAAALMADLNAVAASRDQSLARVRELESAFQGRESRGREAEQAALIREESLRSQIREREARLAALGKALAEKDQEIESRRNFAAQARERWEQSQAEADRLSSALKEKEGEISALRRTLGAGNERETAEGRSREAQEIRLQELQAALRESESRAAQAILSAEAIRKELEELHARAAAAAADESMLKREAEMARRENAALLERLREMEAARAAKTEAVGGSGKGKAGDAAQEALAAREKELDILHGDLERLGREKAELTARLAAGGGAEKEALLGQLEDARKALSQRQAAAAEGDKRIAQLEAAKRDLESRLAARETQLKRDAEAVGRARSGGEAAVATDGIIDFNGEMIDRMGAALREAFRLMPAAAGPQIFGRPSAVPASAPAKPENRWMKILRMLKNPRTFLPFLGPKKAPAAPVVRRMPPGLRRR